MREGLVAHPQQKQQRHASARRPGESGRDWLLYVCGG